jgi:hypothetical protein
MSRLSQRLRCHEQSRKDTVRTYCSSTTVRIFSGIFNTIFHEQAMGLGSTRGEPLDESFDDKNRTGKLRRGWMPSQQFHRDVKFRIEQRL